MDIDTARPALIDLARELGADSAAQCASGEAWDPADILPGDWDALCERVVSLGLAEDVRDAARMFRAHPNLLADVRAAYAEAS